MNVARLLSRAATIAPGNNAVMMGAATVSDYATLASRAGSLAGELLSGLQLASGDRVLLLMSNCPEYVECLFACWHAGLVCVPVNARLHEREIAFIVEHSGARAAFVTPDLSVRLSGALIFAATADCAVIEIGSPDYRRAMIHDAVAMRDAAPDDSAWLFYTSGTTGRPKGATLTHRNLLAMTSGYFTDVDAPGPGDCILHAAPMSHGSGLYILPHVAAMAAQVLPQSGHFDPAEVLDLFGRLRGISIFAAPTMVNRLVHSAARGGAFPGLRTLIYGGGPMYVEDCKAALGVFGQRLVQIYGQGETPMTITVLPKRLHAEAPGLERRIASVGYPQAAVEVAVVGENGAVLSVDEVGEIAVRGDTVMSGYWNDPEATLRTLRDGWLMTGDLGSVDDAGMVTLRDRSKDVIISGGSNIYPREIEETLLRHPGVAEVAVVGRVSSEWGEEAVAFIVPGEGGQPSSAALDAICGMHIARFKRPKEYRFVMRLPKNNYGKVVKTELRSLLSDGPDGDTSDGAGSAAA